MHVDVLFLETLRDLEQRVKGAFGYAVAGTTDGAREYEALMIAPLLRKLLLDGRPLVDLVNRARRLPIRYPVQYWPILSGSAAPGVAVDVAPGEGRQLAVADPAVVSILLDEFIDTHDMTKDAMLAKPVMSWNGQRITARELIRHAAHVEGAVHVSEPTDERERMLADLGRDLRYREYPGALVCLASVGRVVLLGVAPLRGQITHDLDFAASLTSC